MLNVTRRVMRLDKGHTFSYQNKEYPVSALIEFCKGRPTVEFAQGSLDTYLESTTVERVWGSYDDRRKVEIPVTLAELVDHFDRVRDADCSYPIIVLSGKETRILDGIHRIIKWKTSKHERLRGVILTESDMVDFTSGC